MVKYISPQSNAFFAFNIWNIESAKAVIDGAAKLKNDVILQTSTKAFEQMDLPEIRSFVTSYSNKKNIKAFLHLDHCKNLEHIKSAIKEKWNSVMIDASDKPIEENIELTNIVTDLAHKENILVESEIGMIKGVEDNISVKEEGVANINDVQYFIKNTDVDLLAIAIGTAHGLYKGLPNIHYDMIEKTAALTNIPLVIHGGTGLTDEMFKKLLAYKNVKKINISTEVKLAYKKGIEAAQSKGFFDSSKFDPLNVTTEIHNSIMNMTIEKCSLL